MKKISFSLDSGCGINAFSKIFDMYFSDTSNNIFIAFSFSNSTFKNDSLNG